MRGGDGDGDARRCWVWGRLGAGMHAGKQARRCWVIRCGKRDGGGGNGWPWVLGGACRLLGSPEGAVCLDVEIHTG